ncbi:MAG: response regulator [Pontiellaceae bacterium]|nr:response regulator [Pontiellaceae bacterium]MBN2784137.1 response regulator [Pontiellaceae bacterium]
MIGKTWQKGVGTVMVVDDEECLRHVAGIALTASGYNVLNAGSAEAALEMACLHEGRIDLLLTDVRLPNANGIQLANRIRQAHPDIRIVFMTAYCREEVEAWIPGEDILTKPFDLEALCTMVGRSISKVA